MGSYPGSCPTADPGHSYQWSHTMAGCGCQLCMNKSDDFYTRTGIRSICFFSSCNILNKNKNKM